MSDAELGIVERCPICEPLSYYEGKSGLEEVAGPVCDMCAASLNHYAIAFDGVRGTHYFPVTTEIVECKEHAKAWNLLLWDSPFSVIRDGCNFVFERSPAIPMKELLEVRMSAEKRLREAAEQLRKEGNYGWSTNCEQGAARIAELEEKVLRAPLGWDDRIRELEAENQRLRDKALKIGKAFMADTPFDTYHGIDIHETASDYAEWDGRTGEILPMDYFDALVRCCKESQALLGGGDGQNVTTS